MNTGKQKWSRIYKLAFKLNLDEFIEAMNTESPAMSLKPQEEITDEMIEKEFPLDRTIILKKEYSSDLFSVQRNNSLRQEGAKWAISQMTANRREELIKFVAWAIEDYNKPTKVDYAISITLIDEYLTTLNQKEEK